MKKMFFLGLLFLIGLNLNAQSLRIDIKELSKNLDKYKILDVRKKEIYELAHIKNALNFPANLSYENESIDGKIIQPNKMQKIVRNLGLNINDKVVIYDDGSFFDAARIFWTFEAYGFENIKLLNAGFNEWGNLKLPISFEIEKTIKSNYIVSINHKRLATKFKTQIAIQNPNQIIIDARTYNSYVGKKSIAKRFGHIPKAINISAKQNIVKNDKNISRLKNLKELQKVYKNVEKNKKIVVYCAIGKIAATNYFALRELGYDVSNYDASWKEWGNDFNLPIVNLSQK